MIYTNHNFGWDIHTFIENTYQGIMKSEKSVTVLLARILRYDKLDDKMNPKIIQIQAV